MATAEQLSAAETHQLQRTSGDACSTASHSLATQRDEPGQPEATRSPSERGPTHGGSTVLETDDIELNEISRQVTITAQPAESTMPEERLASDLAPVDSGRGAWSYLIGASVVAAISWAFPTTYGLFLPVWFSYPEYSTPEARRLLPLVGTLGSGLMYCSGPIIYPLIARYPGSRRPCLWAGAILCFVSLFASSYVRSVSHLLLLQGVLYGIGGAILYAPSMSYLSEWFQARRATANGIIFAGNATGGILMPLVLPPLFHRFGPSLAVRYIAFAELACLVPALVLIRPRLKNSTVVRMPARGRSGWLRSRGLWILMATNTIQAMAYFVPLLWLPTFAEALDLTDEQGSIALILVNSVAVVSRISVGMLADRFSPWLLAVTTLAAVSIVTFVIWGYFATGLSTLFVYCAAYGVTAGGWTSLWTGFMKPITRDDPVSATTILGFLLLSRGIGNVLSAPISTALLHPQRGAGGKTGFGVGGSMFQSLIVYTGVLFAGAAVLVGAGWGLEWLSSEADAQETHRS